MKDREWRSSILGGRPITARERALPFFQKGGNGLDYFLDGDGFHAAEIDGAFAEKAGTAFDLMAMDFVTRAERTGEMRLRRAEDGDDRHSEEGGEVHRAGIVRKQ